MRLHNCLLAVAVLTPLWPGVVLAGPNGAQVVGGSATVSGQGSANVTVNQFSDKAIINWRMFDIGVGEKTTFIQPNSNSIALNRVTGDMGPTQILGSLNANGKVFVVNPDGIIFGAGAVINTAGFLATTSDIRNRDFMAGRFNFQIPGRPDASIVNKGAITATSGGFAALVAPGVRNSGTITANLGSIALGAGNIFTLDFYGDKLITLGVNDKIASYVKDVSTGHTLKSLVSNTGVLKASGGRVELTAAAARHVVDSVINTSGVIEANSVGLKNGAIILSAATNVKDHAPTQTVKISGNLSAAGTKFGTKGGKIVVTGENIEVAGATINASGRDGGGAVMIGTDRRSRSGHDASRLAETVNIDATSRIDVSATKHGNGGDVFLRSEHKTTFTGTILALGGRHFGDGGFVEASSRDRLYFTGDVDTRAPKGEVGTVLLGASSYRISDGPGSPHGSWSTGSNLQNLLAANNVAIVADSRFGKGGDIVVNAPVAWTTHNLTLSASHDIALNSSLTNTVGGLTLDAGGKITAPAAVQVGTFTLQHGFWIQNSPNLPAFSVDDFRIAGGHFLRVAGGDGSAKSPYAIADVYGLAGIGGLGGHKTFSLANDIDAAGTKAWNGGAGFVPIGDTQSPFLGAFDGQGHSISNLTIASAGFANVGLLGVIGHGATVRNLNINSAHVMAGSATPLSAQSVGLLVGRSAGTIDNVSVTGAIGLDGYGIVGGLVGINSGRILNSSASTQVAVTSAAASIGGLAGFNATGATISDSHAHGNVVFDPRPTSSTLAAEWLIGWLAERGVATVPIDVLAGPGGYGIAGGLVGINGGNVFNSSADTQVAAKGAAAAVGGLVGYNAVGATIGDSQAHGNVAFDPWSASSIAAAGGLVGVNAGTITATLLKSDGICGTGASCATGNVRSGTNADDNTSVGNVSSPALIYLGGLIGLDAVGATSNSFATGDVAAAGPHASVGGLVGALDKGSIGQSYAIGTVAAGGSFSYAGGLVGLSSGFITQTSATGAVTGGNESLVAGLVAFNEGSIAKSYATGAVTGGTNSYVAGLVARNLGSIDQTYAIGRVTGGPGGVTGGLVATDTGSTVSTQAVPVVAGTTTNSYWDVQTTGQNQSAGGTPRTTAELTSGIPTGFDTAVWISPTGFYPCFTGQCTAPSQPNDPGQQPIPTNPLPGPAPDPQPIPTNPLPGPAPDLPSTPLPTSGPTTPQPPPVSDPPRNQPNDSQIISANILNKAWSDPPQPGELFNLPAGGGDGGAPSGPSVGNAGGRPSTNSTPGAGFGPLPSGMPPARETRFMPNEVVMQLGANFTPERIAEIARELGLEIISQHTFSLLGRNVYRFRIVGGRTVREVIRALEAVGVTVSAQPSYAFELTQGATTPGIAGRGDASQYIVSKLGLVEAHGIAIGRGVKIAVIDSEIDAQHPDLKGIVSNTFDALPSNDQKPHPHGTGMAGAIGSHQRLKGVAPGAQILGIRAFGVSSAEAQGTSINIVKGLEWAVQEGAQVINMSFAGPRDPILEQALKGLKERGIILIAAAGNAGPKSPPLFPGADPSVIAVTATDAEDQTYKGANRGKHVAIAAPGVDVLVPAPGGAYQLTTGTSVAAAHVSGVVSLLLERNPQLSPTDVRNILSATARKLPQGRNEIGAGLVDPVQALARSGAKQALAR